MTLRCCVKFKRLRIINTKIKDEDIDIEQLKYFKSLSPKQKLDWLEKFMDFLNLVTPAKNKKAWQKLKDMGF